MNDILRRRTDQVENRHETADEFLRNHIGKQIIDQSIMQKADAGRESLLREGSFLFAYMPSEPHGEGGYRGELWKKLEPGDGMIND